MTLIPIIIVGMPTMVDIVAMAPIMAMVTAVTTTMENVTTDVTMGIPMVMVSAVVDIGEANEQVLRTDAQAIIVDRQPS